MRQVIVGNSAAGISALEALREVDGRSEVTVISAEPSPAYARIFLPQYIAGRVRLEEMVIRPPSFYEQLGATLLLGERVIHVDVHPKILFLSSRKEIPFDNLLIATGGSPNLPPIPGMDLAGVRGLRTIEDAEAILQSAEETERAVIVGGGPIGLHVAEALLSRGLKVSLIVSSPQLLSQMLDSQAAGIVQREVEKRGVEVRLWREVARIMGSHTVEGVVLDGGEEIECGLVIVSKGIQPNIELVKRSPIAIRKGILVDLHQRSSLPGIYAAGDVAESFDVVRGTYRLNGMWPNAVEQGRIAGYNMAGLSATYRGGVNVNIGVFFGVSLASIGLRNPSGWHSREIVLSRRGSYRKLILQDGRIVGATLVGDLRGVGALYSLILQHLEVVPLIDQLIKLNFSFAGRISASQNRFASSGEHRG